MKLIIEKRDVTISTHNITSMTGKILEHHTERSRAFTQVRMSPRLFDALVATGDVEVFSNKISGKIILSAVQKHAKDWPWLDPIKKQAEWDDIQVIFIDKIGDEDDD
jgi:hypothetical protein